MASGFPNTLDSFSTAHADNVGEVIQAATDNDQNDALNKIEAELGTIPKGVYTSVKDRLEALENPLPNRNVVTNAAYTLVLGDASGYVTMNDSTTPRTVTIPPNASVAFPVGTTITIRQVGTQQVTVAPGVGVTLTSRDSAFKLAGRYAYATLVKSSTNGWDLIGDIAV